MGEVVPRIDKMDEWQKKQGGIQVDEQKTGTKITITTKNSVYQLEVLDPKKLKMMIQGGRWEEPVEILFNGSTWGGSMLKIGWIGCGMSMEFCHPEKQTCVIHTSFVNKAKIEGTEYEYEFNWPDDSKRKTVILDPPSS